MDGLDKIRRVPGLDEGLPSHKSLFLDNASKFVGLAASFVLTIPLTLYYANPGALRNAYGSSPFSLPMVKVATRTGERYPAGYEKLTQLLAARGATAEVIEPEAMRMLIEFSGGHVRDLLSSVREAISYATGDVVDVASARAALGLIVSNLSIGKAMWARLAELERDPDKKLDPEDPLCAGLLEQLFALEYINGGGETNFLEEDDAWYAVNPILRGLRSFRTALAAYDSAHPTSTNEA